MYGTVTVATLVISFYNLACFFQALLDYWNEPNSFVFKDNQLYLYVGLATLVLFAGLVVKYFEDKKNRQLY